MAPPDDPRDAEFVEAVVSAVCGLMIGVHRGDHLRIFGEINQLMTAIIEHNKTLGERPSDEHVRRPIAALTR